MCGFYFRITKAIKDFSKDTVFVEVVEPGFRELCRGQKPETFLHYHYLGLKYDKLMNINDWKNSYRNFPHFKNVHISDQFCCAVDV